MTDERWLPPSAPTPLSQPPAPLPPSGERQRPGGLRGLAARLGAPLAALLAFFSKIKLVFLALTKVNFLVTASSMAVSIAAYATIWGWRFGVGFVLLLLVHEYGHVIQLRREGVRDVRAPLFIPFLGALIWARSLGDDAAAEARTGLAGPILGSVGALVCLIVYALTGATFWQALAYTGFFLNLFNLLPISPLDGGRAAAALSPWVWLLGVFGMVVLVLTIPNPIIILIAVVAIYQTYARFRQFRSGDPAVRAYYAIARRDRILIGATYLALVLALTGAMTLTHLHRTL